MNVGKSSAHLEVFKSSCTIYDSLDSSSWVGGSEQRKLPGFYKGSVRLWNECVVIQGALFADHIRGSLFKKRTFRARIVRAAGSTDLRLNVSKQLHQKPLQIDDTLTVNTSLVARESNPVNWAVTGNLHHYQSSESDFISSRAATLKHIDGQVEMWSSTRTAQHAFILRCRVKRFCENAESAPERKKKRAKRRKHKIQATRNWKGSCKVQQFTSADTKEKVRKQRLVD